MSSLVAFALRIAAVRAIRGATYAGERVHDSTIAAVDHMVESGNSEPFIVVSSEDEEAENIMGRDFNTGDRTVDLVIEVAIAHAVALTPNATDDEPAPPEIVIPATDASLELTLTLISRQIYEALFNQRANDPWARIFARMAFQVRKVQNRRGVGNKDSARFAARQIILTLDVMHEPSLGQRIEDGDIWAEFIAALEADPQTADIAPLVRSVIVGDGSIEDWDRERSDQGLTVEAAENIHLGPISGHDEGPVLVADGTLEDRGRPGDGDGV